MFDAGTGTSSLVLELALAELMRHPHIMTTLQAEVWNKTPNGEETVKLQGCEQYSF
jgi:cytochrome P450